MKKYIFLVLVVLFLVLPFLVKASVLSEPLVQCGTRANETPCTLCDVFKLVQRIINFISYGLFILAPIFIVYGGIMILLAGAKPSNVETGKNIIKNAIIGVIIALLAWTVINTLFNTLVSEDKSKFPGPWNVIECTGGGVVNYGYQDKSYKCYKDPGSDRVECTSDCIDGTDCTSGGGTVEPEQYCACEVPVYAMENQTIQLFTEIKGTDLQSIDNCKTNCIAGNAGNYCPNRKTATNPKLYCASQKGLQNISTFCWKQESTTDFINGACFADQQTCYDNAASNNEYIKKCWLDDNIYCGCTTGMAQSCGSSKPIGLYQTQKEVGVGGLFNAWDCTKNCSISGGYCKVGSSGGGTTGTCQGSTCSDSNLNICGKTAGNCSSSQIINRVNSWDKQIQSAAFGKSICSGINTIAFVKSIMAEESGGDITTQYGQESSGLMHLLLETANTANFKSSCGVTDTITLDWLKKPENAEKQICIAIEYMKSFVGNCGCDVRQLAAGYNGGSGACDQSANCGSAAKTNGGECSACSGEQFTRRWECLWDDNKHTLCNVARPVTSLSYARKYVPKVNYCYDKFSN